MPPKTAFPTAAEYYGTALHELAHWSGASHRLNRETLTATTGFGTETYAREELRAELASVFIAAERGISCNLENNAAYIDSWLKTLRKDKNEIFRAARDAHKAADFLLAFEHEKSLAEAIAIAKGKTRETTEAAAEVPTAAQPAVIQPVKTTEPTAEAARLPFIPRGFRPEIPTGGSAAGMEM
jgi:antirestriction protein ArdC